MERKSVSFFFSLFMGVLLCLACAKETPLKTISIQINQWKITVEIADTQESQEKGLMWRDTMEEDHGMLFVYDRDARKSFWMKDTKIPLSIAYIAADGTIREIYDMEPLSRRTVDSRYSVRYALEVNQGAFERHGIKVGDKVEFTAP